MRNRPETLIILTPGFPANESETRWLPAQQLFVKTVQAAYPALNIIILTFYYPDEAGEYRWNGLPVIRFNGKQKRKWRRIFFWGSVWKKLNAIRRENKVTGLLSFWCGECALLGHYFGKRYGIRHYCWLCGQDARKTNKLVKLIRPRPEELIGMSDFLVREFYRNHGIRPAYMIPNAIDPKAFPSPPASGKDIDILAVGSLLKIKRYDLFVEAVKILHQSYPGLRAVLCGDGGEDTMIQQLIKEAGLTTVIALPGALPHPQTLGLMQRARVFLHTSEYEGFGVVCLEALYAGAQVISFIKPLDREIANWHIVQTVEEMTGKALQLLAGPVAGNAPELLYSMEDSVKAMMHLFK